jgi:hypothetical protein
VSPGEDSEEDGKMVRGLREVDPGDVAVFYEHQADGDASRLATVASRD